MRGVSQWAWFVGSVSVSRLLGDRPHVADSIPESEPRIPENFDMVFADVEAPPFRMHQFPYWLSVALARQPVPTEVLSCAIRLADFSTEVLSSIAHVCFQFARRTISSSDQT
jgi:hypothetical protein